MKALISFLMTMISALMLNAQNVGIGTIAPIEKLHISEGKLRLSRVSQTGSNNIIFDMPPGDIIVPESQGLQFSVDNISRGWIELVNSGSSGNMIRLSVSSPGSNDLVIEESGSVGIGTANPSNSAVLDMSSTSKGVLVPRMSKANRDGISSPATGLLLFQTNETPGFYYNAGSSASPNWVNIAKRVDTLSIGAEAFFPRSSSSPYVTDANSARYINVDGSTEQLRAVVHFPAGVTVKQMKVFYYDESASSNLKFTLNENYLALGARNETVFDHTSSSTVAGVRTATINDNLLVKNNLYSYYINAMPATGGSWNGADLKIKGVMLVYEY